MWRRTKRAAPHGIGFWRFSGDSHAYCDLRTAPQYYPLTSARRRKRWEHGSARPTARRAQHTQLETHIMHRQPEHDTHTCHIRMHAARVAHLSRKPASKPPRCFLGSRFP